MADELLVKNEGRARVLTINRPASRNALTLSLNERIIAALKEAAGDASVGCLVLTGAGGAFCSGVDLRNSGAANPGFVGVEEHLRNSFHGIIRSIRSLPAPTIAQIDGPAVGFGCDLALACDLRICSDRAKLGEIFVRRGLIPDGGGTYQLPRLVGLGRALELLYTGDAIDGAEAVRIGLANRVVPAAELERETLELARRIGQGPPLALRRMKALVYRALGGDLDQALEAEVNAQAACLRSKDFIEGVTAFFQKRTPSFRGE